MDSSLGESSGLILLVKHEPSRGLRTEPRTHDSHMYWGAVSGRAESRLRSADASALGNLVHTARCKGREQSLQLVKHPLSALMLEGMNSLKGALGGWTWNIFHSSSKYWEGSSGVSLRCGPGVWTCNIFYKSITGE